MTDGSLLFLYAGVIAVLVRTFTKEELFREPRKWLLSYAEERAHPLVLRKTAFMFTCEYCLSFWVSLILVVGVFDYRLVFADWRGYLISVLATMGIANVYMSVFNWLRIDLHKEKTVVEHLDRRKTA
jgi:hypothetical protein